MSPSIRLGLLALGVSALPFAAHAEPTASRWVYGIDARADRQASDEGLLAGDGVPPDGVATIERVRRPPPPPPPPAPAPAPAPGNNTGAGVIVGVVDTGIDLTHPEFAGRIAAGGTCFGGATVCAGLAAQGNDDNGHGTHVAGIIAAAANGVGNTGVAPGALLLPVKVLDANGSGSYSAVASGISYAATHGAKVISMSLGGSSPSTTLLAPLQQAAATSVIVAAAGNGGNALAPGYPAAYATQAGVVGRMLIVGSVNAQNQISTFSQTPGNGGCVLNGTTTTCFKDVFLVAPGENILSTYKGGQYAYMSGTSMATPYVSGVAARVLAASPFLTPQQVVSILLQSATDLGAAGVDAVYGHGLVNLAAALAPIGTQTIATSGATTASFTGAGNVGGAGVSGVLGAGLRNSSIARDVLFFDGFGRDYRTDLTAAVAPAAASIESFVAQDGLFRSVSFVGAGYSVTGFVSDDAGLDGKRYVELDDVVLSARLSEDTSVTLGRNASLGGRVNALDLAASEAYDGLFMSASAMNSPYLALTENATFVAGRVDVGGGVTLTAARAQTAADDRMLADEVLSVEEMPTYLSQDPTHVRSAENTMAAATWRFAPWGLAGVSVVRTYEENSLLGTMERGALAMTADASTMSLGFGARANLGGDWVASVSWSRGETDATPLADGLIRRLSTVQSEAYGLALSKRGVFGENDVAGFAISRPLHITSGQALVTASTGVTDTREILYSTETVDLASSHPETDYELGYTAKLGERTSIQASAMYQQDAGGQAGSDAIAAFATLKTSW